jgi:hypothetical protein
LLVACACWAAGVFLFFSFAGTKLPSYLYPAFPALALLVGAAGISHENPIRLWRRNWPTGNVADRSSLVGRRFLIGSRLAAWLIGVTGFALAAAFALTPVLLERLRPMAGGVLDGVALPVGLPWWLAGLLALGTAAGLLAAGPWRVGFLGAMMVLLLFGGGDRRVWHFQRPLREFSQEGGTGQKTGGQLWTQRTMHSTSPSGDPLGASLMGNGS